MKFNSEEYISKMMFYKSITLILLIATVTGYILAEDEIKPEDEVVPGKLISKFVGRSLFARSLASCAGQFGPVCGDCSTLWVCFYNHLIYFYARS